MDDLASLRQRLDALQGELAQRDCRIQALEQQSAYHRAVLDIIGEAVLVADTTSGQIVAANQRACEMLGYGPDELAALTLQQLGAPPLPELGSPGAEGRRDVEWVVHRKDGTPLNLAVGVQFATLEGQPRFVVNARDVTQHKHAADALAESEDRLRTLINAMPDIVCFKDGDGRWLEANAFDLRLFELEGVAYRGLKDSELAAQSPWYRESFLACEVSDEQAWRTGTVSRGDEVIRRSDGTELIFDVIKVPTYDAQGRRKGLVVVGRDITARKKAEEERLELERRLQHSQKLESLGVLAGGLAHDFNNLLTAISGNLEVALLNEACEGSRSAIEAAMVAARKAAELAHQMLAYSGRGKFVIGPVNLREMISQMARLLRASVTRNISLRVEAEPDLPPVLADSAQLQQVVLNLIVNAAEAIGDQPGVVRATVGVRECDEHMLARSRTGDTLAPGRYVALEVSDNGCGMTADQQQRLFEPFFTSKQTGRGLGLSAVLGIVRGHRGAILVESQPGQGTTITVLLPIQPDLDLTVPSPAPKHARQARPKDAAVLVVDDEELVLSIARRLIESLGYNTLGARDGLEALELLRADGARVGCVVLDLTMPKLDGLATYDRIREMGLQMPVILSSGYSEEEVAGRCAGRELGGFVHKPYRREDMAAVLGRVLSDDDGQA